MPSCVMLLHISQPSRCSVSQQQHGLRRRATFAPISFAWTKGRPLGASRRTGSVGVYVLVPEMVARLRVLPPKQVTQGPNKGEWRVFGYGDKHGLRRPWKKACEEAGIEYRTQYEAGRHSFFTETVVRNGADVVTAGRLGNCTPAILFRRYAHADAAEKLAHSVFGAGTKQTQRKCGKLKP